MPYSTVVSIRLSSRVDKFFVRPSVVASLSWPNRGHHVPALTVTSGGRGVGFDMHAWGCLVVHFSIFFTSRGFGSISPALYTPTLANQLLYQRVSWSSAGGHIVSTASFRGTS